MGIYSVLRFTAVLCFCCVLTGNGQTRKNPAVTNPLEISLIYTRINLHPFRSAESGVGARMSYNIRDYLAVEGEGSLFEGIGDGPPTNEVLGGQGFFGIKAGARYRRVGLFAKLRPGFSDFPKLKIRQGFCVIGQSCGDAAKSGFRFALDAGSVLEIYPTRHLIFRLDAGDTMIRFSDDTLLRLPEALRIKDGFSHNFQFTVGVGYRF